MGAGPGKRRASGPASAGAWGWAAPAAATRPCLRGSPERPNPEAAPAPRVGAGDREHAGDTVTPTAAPSLPRRGIPAKLEAPWDAPGAARAPSTQPPGLLARRESRSPGAEGRKAQSRSPGARPGSPAPSAEGLSACTAHRGPQGAPPARTCSAAGHSWRGTGPAGRARGGGGPSGGAAPARSKFSIRKLLPRPPKPGAGVQPRSAEAAAASQEAPARAAAALGSMAGPRDPRRQGCARLGTRRGLRARRAPGPSADRMARGARGVWKVRPAGRSRHRPTRGQRPTARAARGAGEAGRGPRRGRGWAWRRDEARPSQRRGPQPRARRARPGTARPGPRPAASLPPGLVPLRASGQRGSRRRPAGKKQKLACHGDACGRADGRYLLKSELCAYSVAPGFLFF